VGGPAAPLHAVHRAEVVRPFAVRVGQPGGVLVGVLIPYLAAQRAEIGRAARAAQEAHQLADGGLEGQFLGRDRREALLQVEAQGRAGQRQRAYAGAVLLPRAVVENGLDQREVLFHVSSGGPAGGAAASGGRRGLRVDDIDREAQLRGFFE